MLQNSQEDICTGASLSVKLQTPNVTKKETLAHSPSCEFCNIFKNISGRLLSNNDTIRDIINGWLHLMGHSFYLGSWKRPNLKVLYKLTSKLFSSNVLAVQYSNADVLFRFLLVQLLDFQLQVRERQRLRYHQINMFWFCRIM